MDLAELEVGAGAVGSGLGGSLVKVGSPETKEFVFVV